jgi:hypothetical protein
VRKTCPPLPLSFISFFPHHTASKRGRKPAEIFLALSGNWSLVPLITLVAKAIIDEELQIKSWKRKLVEKVYKENNFKYHAMFALHQKPHSVELVHFVWI